MEIDKAPDSSRRDGGTAFVHRTGITKSAMHVGRCSRLHDDYGNHRDAVQDMQQINSGLHYVPFDCDFGFCDVRDNEPRMWILVASEGAACSRRIRLLSMAVWH